MVSPFTHLLWATVQEAGYGGATGSLESLYSLFWGALLRIKLGDEVQPQLCFAQMETDSLRRWGEPGLERGC